MTPVTELDPVAIREALAGQKRRARTFDAAWRYVIGELHGHSTDTDLCRFMEKHFRAAYLNLPTANGRWAAPDADPGRKIGERVPVDLSRVREDGCRWGEGCEGTRGHGETGLFCKRHAAVLAEIKTKPVRPFNGSLADVWDEAA